MVKKKGLIDHWTSEEDEKLRKHYPNSTSEQLVKLFNRSLESIKGRAYRLRLRKDPLFIQAILKEKTRNRWRKGRK